MKRWCMILIAFELLTITLDVSRDCCGLSRFLMAWMFLMILGSAGLKSQILCFSQQAEDCRTPWPG